MCEKSENKEADKEKIKIKLHFICWMKFVVYLVLLLGETFVGAACSMKIKI